MKNSKIAFLTTVFPNSESFLLDFLNSLNNQTFKNFDLIVINDGIYSFFEYIKNFPKLNFIEIKSNNTPAKNREIGINRVIELGYKFIIFGDSDDMFSENRIEKIIEAFEYNDIVINELTIFDNKKFIKNFISENTVSHIKPLNYILDSNIMGFSNIAINTKLINKPIKFENKIIAVDWYFSTILSITKPRIKFLKNVNTYYRQHNNNIIGMSLLLNDEKLNLGIRVKKNHYKALMKYFKKNRFNNLGNIYAKKYLEIIKLENELQSINFKKNYIKIVNKNIRHIYSGWWSQIINLEKFYTYEKNSNK